MLKNIVKIPCGNFFRNIYEKSKKIICFSWGKKNKIFTTKTKNIMQYSLLNSFLLFIFLFIFISVNSVFAMTWETEVIDAPKNFTKITQRSIAIDKNTNYPHIVYGDDALYHTYYNGSAWEYETVNIANAKGKNASIAIDSNSKIHLIYIEKPATSLSYGTTLTYATNESGTWQTYLVDLYCDGDASIAIDSNNKVHISYRMYYYGSLGSLKYVTNAGDGWQKDTILDSESPTKPNTSIALDSNDKAYILYRDANNNLKYMTNADGSWKNYIIDTLGDSYSIAIDSSNNIHVSYFDNINKKLKYAIRTVNGWQITVIESLGEIIAPCTSIAVDSNNKAHISYFDYGNKKLKYATNAIDQWQITIIDNSWSINSIYSSIALDTNNKVHIGYSHISSCDLKYTTKTEDNWQISFIDKAKDAGSDSSIGIDSKNKIHICYYEDKAGDLKYATNEFGDWQITTIDSTGLVGENPSLAVDSNNKIHICYINSVNGDLKYATNVLGDWQITTIENSGKYKWNTSIAVDSNNKVHISYYDRIDSNLKYITNSLGDWQVTTVDNNYRCGWNSSLILDPNNKVHIAYYDDVNQDLKYATNALGVWLTVTIDSVGKVGNNPAIAIDKNNILYISYTDQSDYEYRLKYATGSFYSWQTFTIDPNGVGIIDSHTSIAIDSNNKFHIIYYETYPGDQSKTIKYATNRSGSIITYTICNLLGNFVDFPMSLALDSNNKAHISFYDYLNYDLKYITNANSNDAPNANAGADQNVFTEEPVNLSGQFSSDPDTDALAYSWTQTSGTTVTLSNATSATPIFTPTTSGTYVFQLIVNDGKINSVADSVTITVTKPNSLPVANNDTAETNEDTPIIINVTANDTDVDGDSITINITTAAGKGKIVITQEKKTLMYTPNANVNGEDSFTYAITDGKGGNAIGTVNINIISINDAPVAVADAKTVYKNFPATIDVKANDTDTEKDTLTVTSITQGNKGVATVNNNLITYTANPNTSETDTFKYTINDGNNGSAEGTVTITITATNNAPVTVNDTKTVTEDTPALISVLSNDSDPDKDTLTISAITPVKNGKIVINETATAVTYTPNLNVSGVYDTFFYTAFDGKDGTAIGKVSITITAVNDLPIALSDSTVILEDSAPVTINVTANDSDVDNDNLTVSAISPTTKGTTTKTTNSKSIIYTPKANENGIENFTYTLSDGKLTALGKVKVTILGINDIPIAKEDLITTNEDTPIIISVLTNDSDADKETLFITKIDQPAEKGTTAISLDNKKITYTPYANINGTDQFTYVINDGRDGYDTGTVKMTITAVNNAPVALDDSKTTNSNTSTTIEVLLNDSDLEKDKLTISSIVNGAKGTAVINATAGTITYTPKKDISGTDVFKYGLSDGGKNGYDTANVFINIVPVKKGNTPPIANDDMKISNENTVAYVKVIMNDIDKDYDTLSVIETTKGENGSTKINANGTITYIPNINFRGKDSFKYTISDGSGEYDTAQVIMNIIEVTAGNKDPIANDDVAKIDEDTPITIYATANDTDENNNKIELFEFSNVKNGNIVNNKDGTLVYTPNPNFFGTDELMYFISDNNGGYDSATINITISEINDIPVAIVDPVATDENTPIKIDVLNNDIDEDNDVLSITDFTQGTKGTVTINDNGTLTYTPNLYKNGADTFSYSITDGKSGTSIGNVNVTIKSINNAPNAIAGSDQTVNTGTVVTLNGSASNDPDEDTITYKWTQVEGPAVMLSSSNTTNASFTPEIAGTYAFQLIVNDKKLNSTPSIVTITVNGETVTPNTNTISVGGGKKGCVITNAIKNKNTISLINEIKDKYLLQSNFGKEIVNLYYKVTTKLELVIETEQIHYHY